MSTPRPTLKDVAERAGVSFKTVSRVVNDESGVSPAMADRVHTAIAELGYRRNHSAQALRRGDGRLGTVGIVHADAANPFAAAVHAAFERHLRTSADTLVLSGSSHQDPHEQDRLVDAFIARQVDGLAVIPFGDQPGPALQRELEPHRRARDRRQVRRTCPAHRRAHTIPRIPLHVRAVQVPPRLPSIVIK